MAKEKKARVLTPKEEARKARTDAVTAELAEQGFERKDLTISIVFANVMAIALGLPFIIGFVWWYFARNGFKGVLSPGEYLVFVIALLVLTVVHELIHGLTWGLAAPNRFKTIEFGFIKEALTPYCTCGEPLSRGTYILGSFMPGLVLGILPCVAAVFTESLLVLSVGLVMIIGAGGDFTIILKMLAYRSGGKKVIFLDHPTECGVIVFEKEK